MENTSPDKRIELIFRLLSSCTIYKKMKVQITSDCIKIILNVLNLFHFPKHLHVLHFRIDQIIESFDQLLAQLECKFIFREITKTLIQQPNVHISNTVMDMEVVLQLELIYKLSAILI